MNLVSALNQLRRARHYVEDGRKCLNEQRKLVERLERRGFDSLDAILLLEQLEEMQEKYLVHCDQLGRQVLGLLKAEDEEDQ